MASDDAVDDDCTSITGLVGSFVPPTGRIDHARRLRRRLHGGPRPSTPPRPAPPVGAQAAPVAAPAAGTTGRAPSSPLAGLAGAVRSRRLRGRAQRTVARWDALAGCAARQAGSGRPGALPAAALALLPIVLVGGLLALALAGVVLLATVGRALLVVGRPVRLVVRPPAVGDEPRPAGT